MTTDVGKKSVARIARDVANSWNNHLTVGQRKLLATEIEYAIKAVLAREHYTVGKRLLAALAAPREGSINA